jgi:hypothetical protein
MNERPIPRPGVLPATDDPNIENPNVSPLEPTPNDPFTLWADDNPMPVENPTPGGVPPAPATDQ